MRSDQSRSVLSADYLLYIVLSQYHTIRASRYYLSISAAAKTTVDIVIVRPHCTDSALESPFSPTTSPSFSNGRQVYQQQQQRDHLASSFLPPGGQHLDDSSWTSARQQSSRRRPDDDHSRSSSSSSSTPNQRWRPHEMFHQRQHRQRQRHRRLRPHIPRHQLAGRCPTLSQLSCPTAARSCIFAGVAVRCG